jgi:TRAP-type C4-dicarboxylate transport system substrate-binding protein
MSRKKSLSRLLVLVCLLVLVSATFLSGCSQPPEVTPPDNNEEPDVPEVVEQEPVEFTVNLTVPEPHTAAFKAFVEAVTERTEGKVTFVMHFSNSLLPPQDILKGLSTGVADISTVVPYNYPGALPLNTLHGLPFLGLPSIEEGFDIYWDLLQNTPEMQAEFTDLGLTAFTGAMMAPQQLMISGNQKVVNPSDLNGVKVITNDRLLGEFLGSLGSAPVALPISEYFMSLERGVADAVITHIPAANAFGVLPLVKTAVIFGDELGIMMNAQLYAINDAAWDKMTPETQAIFLDEAQKFQAIEKAATRKNIETYTAAMEENSEFVMVTDEQRAVWAEAARPFVEARIKEYEDAGKPAQQVYDAFLSKIK